MRESPGCCERQLRDLKELREDLERAYLGRLFREVEGDLDEMMRQLGIGRTRLYTWLRNLGLDVRRMRDELDELEGRA